MRMRSGLGHIGGHCGFEISTAANAAGHIDKKNFGIGHIGDDNVGGDSLG